MSAEGRTRHWSFELPRWALAASVAALAVGSFALGRVWDTPTTSPGVSTADVRELSERMLRSEVEEHLERSQRDICRTGQRR
jgi:hypothetical protein